MYYAIMGVMTQAPDQPQVLQAETGEFRLSYSSITTHRKCPQAWVYQYMMRLVPDVELSPTDRVRRDLGSWWHAVRSADALKRGMEYGSLLDYPEKLTTGDDGPVLVIHPSGDSLSEGLLFEIQGSKSPLLPISSSVVIKISQAWWNKAGETIRTAWESELGDSLPNILDRLDKRWRAAWADELLNERPLLVEVRGSRSFLSDPWPDQQPVLYGQVDEVYEDVRRNLVVVRDYKSSGDTPTTSTFDDLMDSQLHLYAWIVETELEKYGKKPQAVAYDRSRTKVPANPTITQAGSLSKSITDYDLATYLEVVGEGIPWGEPDTYYQSGAKKGQPKFGVYTAEDAVIEKLSTPSVRSKWNQRTLTPLNRNILRSHLQAAQDTYYDMVNTQARNEEHGRVARNFGRGCSWCDYLSLCLAQVMGGADGEYSLADHGLKRS